MKTLTAVILIVVLGSSVALADVYSWVDANGIKHFSNRPPPSDARSVRVTAELQSANFTETPSKEEKPEAAKEPSNTLPASSLSTPRVDPVAARQVANELISREMFLLDQQLQTLNQRLSDAELARSRGTSYDNQAWSVRIDAIKNEIDTETRNTDSRIQKIKRQYGLK